MARHNMPKMASVPLVTARPSFSARTIGSRPAPWASGARSPLAPSDPYSGTTGEMPALSRLTMPWATSGRAPL